MLRVDQSEKPKYRRQKMVVVEPFTTFGKLSATPIESRAGRRVLRAFSHLIGESPIALFAVSRLATRYRRRFPRSLDGAPLVLPEEGSAVRRALDDWLHAENVHPDVKAECEDIDLLYACGQAGLGLFPAPVAIASEVCRQYHVVQVGTAKSVVARFYAVSGERRLQHPAVVAITESNANCSRHRDDLSIGELRWTTSHPWFRVRSQRAKTSFTVVNDVAGRSPASSNLACPSLTHTRRHAARGVKRDEFTAMRGAFLPTTVTRGRCRP